MTRKPGILLVDPDARAFVRLLETVALVITTSSVAAALEALNEHRPRLAILEYRLVDGSGLEVVAHIRQKCASMPVLMVTGAGSESVCAAAFRLGVADYLIKPIEPKRLLETVRRLLDASGSNDKAQTFGDEVTDPRGNVRRLTFNNRGYILTDTRALGKPEQRTATYERQTGTSFALAMTDGLNRRTAFTYDPLGNVTSITQLAGTSDAVTTTYTYEPSFNRIATVTDPLNHTTTFIYSGLASVAISDPLNHVTTVLYDSNGRIRFVTSPLNHVTTRVYEGPDLVAIADPLGNTTTFFTDNAGRVVSVTDSRGRRTRYDHDGLDRLMKITDAVEGATRFTYDPNGNLLSVTDARNSVTSYTYDSMDRAISRRDPLLRIESYVYDLAGNLTKVTDRRGKVTNLTYDALNRRTFAGFGAVVSGQNTTYESTVTYTSDAGDRLTQATDSLSGAITRSYDGLDRLLAETTPQGTVSYTYDAASRRTSMTVPGQATVAYVYDNADRLTTITQGTAVASLAYDTAGRRTSLTLPNGVVTDYAYDVASRLTGLTYRSGSTTLGALTYGYDAAGERVEVGGPWARTGLPQPVASASYNSANHQLTFGARSLSYDLNGNLAADGTNTYTWNARNQLVGISGAVPATFVYDALGRRQRKTIDGTVTDFVYDLLNPVRESSGVDTVDLLTGLGIDEHLTRTTAGSTEYFLRDALSSTVSLANGGGTIATEYTYEPFGSVSATGVTTANTFKYTGREDDGTGLGFYRARYYHPTLQRFISEDPIGFRGGINLYAYVRNNPLGYIDPLGLDKKAPNDWPPISPAGEVIPLPPNPGPKPWHHWPEPKMPWEPPATVRDIRPPPAPPGPTLPSWHTLPGLIVPDWPLMQRYLDSLMGPQGGEI